MLRSGGGAVCWDTPIAHDINTVAATRAVQLLKPIGVVLLMIIAVNACRGSREPSAQAQAAFYCLIYLFSRWLRTLPCISKCVLGRDDPLRLFHYIEAIGSQAFQVLDQPRRPAD